jgi:MFS family permease
VLDRPVQQISATGGTGSAALAVPPVPVDGRVLAREGPRRSKVWRAGTLAYTPAALGALFFWLLWGDFTLALKERAVPPTVQLLLNGLSVSNTFAAVMLGTCPALIGMIVTPVVSYRSDRHRGRWGRRVPFLLGPTPLAVVSMAGMAFSTPIGRWLHAAFGGDASTANTTILGCLASCWVLFEVSSIICTAVFSGLCNDVVPRELIGRFFGLFRMVGLGAAIFFNFYLLGRAEAYYRLMFITMAALYGLSFTLMCLKVREGEYPPVAAAERAGGVWHAVRTYWRDCFTHSYYVWLFVSVALANMSFTCVTLFTVFYARAVGMDMGVYGKYLTVQFIVSFACSYPLGWLADKIHPLRLTIVSLVLYGAATLLAFFFIRDARTFGVLSITVGVFAGWWLTANGPLGPVLLPRLKYAQFSSAMGICSSLGVLLVGPACGKFLDVVAGGDYRYIYLWAAVFAALSLAASLVVYQKFRRYGGPSAFVPPDPPGAIAGTT